MDRRLAVSAPAKVNLHLAVGSRRVDGYHEVTTVLQALEFGDEVVITPSVGFRFLCHPDPVERAEHNLGYRAAHLMADRYGRPLDVSVSVDKHIPSGAGLGGASADAAAVVSGLASWWGIDDPAGLAEVARALGADVPFFLQGGAALFVERGDVLARALPSLPSAVVLAKPPHPIATADAYAVFDATGGPAAHPAAPAGPALEALARGDVAAVASVLANNLTAVAEGLVPSLGDLLAWLSAEPGVLGAALSGSGSAVFALCDGDDAAVRIAEAASARGLWAVATRTSEHGCVVTTG